MNIQKFNRIIRIDRKFDVLTGNTINDIYKAEKKKLILFDKDMDTLIKENYEKIIKYRSPGYLASIVKEIYLHESMRRFIEDKMLFNLLSAKSYEIKYLKDAKIDIDWSKLIFDNIDEILSNSNCRKIIRIVETLSYIPEEIKEAINNKFAKNKKEYIKALLFESINANMDKKDENILIDVVGKVIDEVLELEGKELIDIRKLNSGASSEVIEIGTKIIKLGQRRRTYDIPYDERILKPLIRVDLDKISSISGTLEVSNRVITNTVKQEKLYDIYKEMRNRNVICTDLRPDNVGILLEDNKISNANVSGDLETRGFYDFKEEKQPLKKGDIVILDTDYLYKANDKSIIWVSDSVKEFEERYRKEQSQSSLNEPPNVSSKKR